MAPSDRASSGDVKQISSSQLAALRQAGAVLVDVRELGEPGPPCLPGTVQVPYTQWDLRDAASNRDWLVAQLGEPGPPIVAICAHGIRSLGAAHILTVCGYDAVSLRSGMAGLEASDAAMAPRFLRHRLLPEVGAAGQARLLASRVVVVGAGGLGSPAAMYLVAAGVGTVAIIDDDMVDESNLQRQVMHAHSRLGMPKVQSAEVMLRGLWPEAGIVPVQARLTAENALALLRGYDVIVDASDNFATRYAINDAAVALGCPMVSGAVARFEGQLAVFAPGGRPCYRCIFPTAPTVATDCSTSGVLGAVPGTIGAMQATETLKLLLGLPSPLGQLGLYDGLQARMQMLRVAADPACATCGAQ